MGNQNYFCLPRSDRLLVRIRSRLTQPEINQMTMNQLLAEYHLILFNKPFAPTGRGRSQILILNTNHGKKILKGINRQYQTQ
jgi:hypothetical protein